MESQVKIKKQKPAVQAPSKPPHGEKSRRRGILISQFAKKLNSFIQRLIPKIYDPGYKWRSDLWILKWIALTLIFFDFHWLNGLPIYKIYTITIIEFLYFLYTFLFVIFFRRKISFEIQFFNLMFDLLVITSFACLSLSLFAFGSRVYILYLIPVIYCSYWFKKIFTLVAVTVISAAYFLLNYYILLDNMEDFYIKSEILGTIAPVIVFYYFAALVVFFFKRRIQKHFEKELRDISMNFTRSSEFHFDIDKLLKKITNFAAEALEADIVILYRYDEKKNKIIWPPVCAGKDIKFPGLIISEEVSLKTPFSIINSGSSYYSTLSQQDPFLTAKNKKGGKRSPDRFVIREKIVSSAGILLQVGRKRIGIMFINYKTPREFGIIERKIIEVFASNIALALQDIEHLSEKKIADTMQNLGIVVSNFAHKIKNDIATLNLYTDSLMDKINPGMPQSFPLTRLKGKLSKIAEDINFILSSSRSKMIGRRVIYIKSLIDELKAEILPEFNVKKIKFEVDIDPGISKIDGAPVQIKMVLENLAHNSMDAMPDGGEISLAISKSKKKISFVWTDSGSGISLNDAPKIFAFSWSTKEKGFGLGLFHSKNIIEEHGGSISLDLDYKKGARFIIELPAKQPKIN